MPKAACYKGASLSVSGIQIYSVPLVLHDERCLPLLLTPELESKWLPYDGLSGVLIFPPLVRELINLVGRKHSRTGT